jgi:hypothetical protein
LIPLDLYDYHAAVFSCFHLPITEHSLFGLLPALWNWAQTLFQGVFCGISEVVCVLRFVSFSELPPAASSSLLRLEFVGLLGEGLS